MIGPLGVSKTLTGLAAGLLAGRVYRENALAPAVCALLLTLLNETLFWLLSGFAHAPHALRIIGVRAIYHALLTPLVYALAARGQRALARRAPVE
jgi:hypothetical protein